MRFVGLENELHAGFLLLPTREKEETRVCSRRDLPGINKKLPALPHDLTRLGDIRGDITLQRCLLLVLRPTAIASTALTATKAP